MKFRDMIYEVYHALSVNKMRSFLTILGIVIGISSVIAMTSLVGGIAQSMTSSLGLEQARIVTIMPQGGNASKASDFKRLSELMPQYEDILVAENTGGELQAEGNSYQSGMIIGVEPRYAGVMGIETDEGSFFTDQDNASARRVIVVGRGVVKGLFGSEDAGALGKRVSCGAESYTIIGVLKGGGSSQNYGTVYMPLNTMDVRMGTAASASYIGYGIVAEGNDIAQVVEETQRTFAQIIGSKNPSQEVLVYSMEQMLEQVNTVMSGFSALLGAIASISLFVGGIGIMNMMLTNVTERIREIGLRKALGAHARDITKQFLFEAIMLCVMGGIIGIIFGYIGSWALASLVNLLNAGISISPLISLEAVGAATGVSIAVGVVFGYYPARRAAKLDPIEALRYQ